MKSEMICPFCESEMEAKELEKEEKLVCRECGFDMPQPDLCPDPQELRDDEGAFVIDDSDFIE